MAVALDHALREWVVHHRFALLDPIMLAISGAAFHGIVWLVAAAAIAIARRRADVFIGVGLAVLIAGVLTDGVLKNVIHRDRPFRAFPAVAVLGPRPHDSSFPSGHTSGSFAAAGVLASLVPSARVAWWAGAVAVAYSRVYLGVHYPLDVVGGAVVGLCCVPVVLLLLRGVRHLHEATQGYRTSR